MHKPLFDWNLNKLHPNGMFGAVRKYDTHAGIDLYCEQFTKVFCIEDGEVIDIAPFTGEKCGTPWWNNTQAIYVQSKNFIVCYGEVFPAFWPKPIYREIKVGDQVKSGQLLAYVKTVLKKDKGLPTTMLHLEMYNPNPEYKLIPVWELNSDKPNNLLDPTQLILELYK